MEKYELNKEIELIMKERFGKDTVIALATYDTNMPYVRFLNAYYEDGAFYIVTHALSKKMRQIEHNPVAAIAGEWFTAHGNAINLGWFGKEENSTVAEKLKNAFAAWINNGHNDFEDPNTIILCIKITDGVLFSHGTKFDI